jgi:hypothetical protein
MYNKFVKNSFITYWIFIWFFNGSNNSSLSMALGSTRPLTEMSTRKLPGVPGRRLTTSPSTLSRLCRKMWEPRRLTTLRASTAYYRDILTLSLKWCWSNETWAHSKSANAPYTYRNRTRWTPEVKLEGSPYLMEQNGPQAPNLDDDHIEILKNDYDVPMFQYRLFFNSNIFLWKRDRAVGITTGYGLDDQGIGVQAPLGARIFTSPCRPDRFWGPSLSSRQILGPTQPPIQWVLVFLSPDVKRPGREADHSPPSCTKVKKIWIYITNPPYAFIA